MGYSAKNSTSVDWKRRYAELVEQQEKQQARYKRKQDLLVQAVSDLAQYSREIDSKSDEKLRGLQGLLRQDSIKNVDLGQAVDTVQKHLSVSFDSRKKHKKVVATELVRLVKQVSGLGHSPEVRLQLKELKQSIEMMPVEFESLATHLTNLCRLQTLAIKSRRTEQSFLQRWFGQSSTNTETQQATELNLEALSGYLTRLLEEVEHSSDMQGTFEVALNMLQSGLSVDNIELALSSVTEVVLASVSSDRQSMTSYLTDMNQRLQQATENLTVSSELHKANAAAQQQFSDSLHSSVNGMRQQVDQSVDLEQLKRNLHESLDTMMSVVEDNRDQGQQMQSELSEQLSSLVLKAKELESQGAVAQQKAQEQRRRALTDRLTALPNRDAYEETAAREVQRWQRYGRPLCLAVCDIDLFKSVNDSYGHAAGDEVLKQVAELLKQRLRGSDFLSRYGGEEFVLLLPETEIEQAEQVMQSVRELIARSPIVVEDHAISISISIGIAEFKGKDILQSAFTRADRALYQAKLSGRDRVVVSVD